MRLLLYIVTGLLGLLPTSRANVVNHHQAFVEQLPPLGTPHRELMKTMVNPILPYFICKYYIGDEIPSIPIHFLDGNVNATKINSPQEAISKLEELDLIYVPVDAVENFALNYLPQLKKRILLMTGQMNTPDMKVTPSSDLILAHPLIAHWFMHNAVYEDSKVTLFPYGFHPETLGHLLRMMHHYDPSAKYGGVRLLRLSVTNAIRFPLVFLCTNITECGPMAQKEYLELMATAFFVISPIGDRPDCYRHWESIALGAIPICNCPELFRHMFKKNMIITESIQDMIYMLNLSETVTRSMYTHPDRSLVLASYWTKVIDRTKNRLSGIVEQDNNTSIRSTLRRRLTW